MTKKIFKYIILNVLIILFVINLILSYEENTHILGIYMFNIVSESMEPTLNKNDLVLVQKCELSELQEGDIITFKQDDRTISHRIIDITKEKGDFQFKTKGDNNEIADPDKVESGQVYGQVLFRVKGIGNIVSYIQNVRVFINIIIFAIIIYILVSLRDNQKNTRKIKRKKYEIKKMRDNYNLE
ncbi:MAG: signal peptidase I [Clostridia bacterium]|nr:signal peptidase I [Clostridia bacterium]